MNSDEFDDDEAAMDEGDYEYAGGGGDDDDDNDGMNHIRDDDDDESDAEEQVIRKNGNNNHHHQDQSKSQASYNDEMNLIDYVIEEEKEIGGHKGEDTPSTSRSATYSNLFSNDEEDDDNLLLNQTTDNKKQKITAKEEGQMIRARAFLNRLDRKVEEKDQNVNKIRESLYVTKDKITKMEQNKNQLENDIDRAQDQQNVTIVNRLCGELNRLTVELALEQDILIDFQTKLDAAEMDRTRAIIERARYNQEETVLQSKEISLNTQKQSLTKLRQRQEDWKVTQMKRARLSEMTTQKKALEQQAVAQRSAIDEARRSKKLAHKYLHETFEKIRTEKRNEEEASRTETEKKIKSLLNLRNAIERNKDTLAIQTAQKRAQERDLRDTQRREQQSIDDQGQNGLFYMLRKQKNEKLEQMQKHFSEQQERNRFEIVQKILKEDNEKERKRRLYPEFYKKPSTITSSAPIRHQERVQTTQ